MKKIVLLEKEYNLPDKWDEVTLNQYIKLQEIISTSNVETKKIIDIISFLTGIEIDLLYEVSISDLSQIDITWISSSIKKTAQTKIEIDGKKYGAIKDMKNLSVGEYVDLDHYTRENANANLHIICAILMRPVIQEDGDLYIIEKYDPKTIESRANIFLDKMNVVQFFGLSDFFSNSVFGLLKNMTPYSPTRDKKVKKTQQD